MNINYAASTLTTAGENKFNNWLEKNRKNYNPAGFEAWYTALQHSEGYLEIKSYDSITGHTVTLDLRAPEYWNGKKSCCLWRNDSKTLDISLDGTFNDKIIKVQMSTVPDSDCDELTLIEEALDKHFGVDGWTNAGEEIQSGPLNYFPGVQISELTFFVHEKES